MNAEEWISEYSSLLIFDKENPDSLKAQNHLSEIIRLAEDHTNYGDRFLFLVTIVSSANNMLPPKVYENYLSKAIKRFSVLDKAVDWFNGVKSPSFTVHLIPTFNEKDAIRTIISEAKWARSYLNHYFENLSDGKSSDET